MPAPADFAAILPAPFGALGVVLAGEHLAGLEFLPPGSATTPASSPLSKRVEQALSAYYDDPAQPFALPLAPQGTPFRQRVWQALLAIPVGQVITYGELARRVGSAPRAVGQAVGDNPIPVIIPCHRVVAANRSFNDGLGGFMHSRTGYSQDIKRWLLRHEHALPSIAAPAALEAPLAHRERGWG